MKDERKDYLSEEEARKVKELFAKYLTLYKEKEESISDIDWLEQLFSSELPEIEDEENKQDASEIVEGIEEFDNNLKSVIMAASRGISQERWLANKIQESLVGMEVNECGILLQDMDNFLYQRNIELADSLKRSTDGNIKMSPNLDGNIAENLIAKTTELSGFLQNKNIKVEVRDAFTENSVDVRVTNLDTGKYQNYQLKFGKDARSTIQLIERGNYNNQQIIVPTEQLDEIQKYFKEKGSSKTILDHIDAWGAKSKRFTKKEVKDFQTMAQEDGIMPSMDYNHYQTKDLAMSIGKSVKALAIQSVMVTIGLDIASRVFRGEEIKADEIVERGIKTGTDTSIKVVTAGTLQVAIRREIIKFIPQNTPAGVIANIACVGIENGKVLGKIATGELSITRGLDQMGRVTTSMMGSLWGMRKGIIKGAAIGNKLFGWIPVIGVPIAVVTGFVGGMVGYFAGTTIGDAIYSTGKKVANVAKSVAKTVVAGLTSVGRTIGEGISKVSKVVGWLFG